MMKKDKFKGPLAGLNVIDFGHYYAGLMAAMLLADQGANVIRIVQPGKSELPSRQYQLLNRNKKLLTLDLKTQDGKAQALSLIDRADVLIENFRPGVMKRLGLDYANVKLSNPGLVYLSLPGFASTDKNRAHLQAWEGILSAAACVYTEVSEFRRFLDYPPLYTSIPFCSSYGAMNGAAAVMAALVAREKHGVGTVLEVPLVDAGLTAFEGDFSLKKPFFTLRALIKDPNAATDLPLSEALKSCAYSPEDSYEVQAEKIERARVEMMHLYFMYKIYPCADGRGIYLYFSKSLVGKMLKILGLDEKVKREGFVIEDPWEVSLGNNIGNFGSGLTDERKRRLMDLVSEATLQKPAEEWETLLTNAGVHAVVIRTREEWLALEAHLESGFLVNLKDGDTTFTVPGRLVGVSGPQSEVIDEIIKVPESISPRQAYDLFAPRAGQMSSQGSLMPLKKGDLLKGLKVLDLANFVAGPTIAVHLAEFGAEVIKMDAPRYDFHTGALLLTTNQGKRSLLNDLTSAPGRDIFNRLVRWADVVTHNSADGTAERLGATYTQLREINPQVVACQMGAFNGPYRGGWGARGGNEPLVQAACGVMAQYGTLEQAHRCSQVGIGDVPGGYCGVFAALLGIYQQRRTGTGSECRTSLAQVGNYTQLPYMIADNGDSGRRDTHGQFSVGENWHQRIYQCKDGWIYVGVSESVAYVLAEVVAAPRELESTFAGKSCEYWLKKLDEANIACHRVMCADDILMKTGLKSVGNEAADVTAEGAGEILHWENHPCGYPFILLAPDYVRVGENQSYRRITPAPRLGAHTREILAELGYSSTEIDDLIRLRVVYEYFPPLGTKDAFLFPATDEQKR